MLDFKMAYLFGVVCFFNMSQWFSSSHQHNAAADQNAVGVNKDL